MSVQTAVSWLFVPGDRADRFGKAVAAGADAVIIDLEDAVAPDHKDSARRAVADWLAGGEAWVRVNAADTEWHAADLDALAGRPGMLGVVLPKAERAADARSVAGTVSPAQGVVALVESATGLENVAELAGCPATTRIAFGSIDFALDLGCAEDDEALLYARSRLVLASRVAGLPGPIDGVTPQIDDQAALAGDAARARRLGFAGKLVIHPTQISTVGEAFRPTAAERAWAQAIVDASAAAQGRGAIRVDGQLVDRPVLERAQRLLGA